MTAEVSFTKRAAAELSRRFNGLTVRSRGSSSATPNNPSASSTPPSVQQQQTTNNTPSKSGQLTSWMLEGVKRQHQRNQNKQCERIAELLANRPGNLEELWKDSAFLSKFFFYLPSIDRTVLAQVCCKWKEVLYQPMFWNGILPVLHCRELRATSGDLSSTSELRKRVYSSLEKRGFTSLCLFGAGDDDVYDVVSNFPNTYVRQIRSLLLRCCNVTDKGHEVLLEFFHGVVHLEMSGCNEVTDAGLWASLHPRITHLTLADCINVADESVAAIAQLLPSLRELNLQAYHVTDAALAFFGPQQGGTLQVLRLRSCWELTNHGLLNLVHVLPNLTILSLSGCSKVTDDGVELLAENLRQLRILDLSWCPRITDAALEYIACDLSLLEELILDRCVHVTDIGVGYLSTMVNLRILYLRWCTQIRDFGLQHLCTMRSLQILSLAGCPLLTSSGLSSLVQLRELRELELTNCAGASEELFEYLRQHLPLCLVIE
ncbi:F-box/LRR-repeat protein 16 isoform X2 [Parasteatoda tepidariorum]|uniref:F-box/LRR-repeat protein 16 isoform X1 n=1 Tax=Parasteatoda tepidariorum TaxID=114398 RepID=UPI00077F9397|nr:F-box/LRR-repeat protein 16 isoform X1 [Parasteatoda tepidariorum]XP_042899263.1 F-box/LRR-repeat protein 16 isoform X2 [Parasteatoda tepidariorum]